MSVSPRLTRAIAKRERADQAAAEALAELYAAIADEIHDGGRGVQAQVAAATGLTRERIRQITREAERAA